MLVFSSVLHAVENEPGSWFTASTGKSLAEKWRVGIAVQTRMLDGINTLERVVLRPSITYRMRDSMLLSLGYDAHLIRAGSNRTEQRLWQQLHVIDKAGIFTPFFRFRLEQRFFENIDGTTVRGRFLVGTSFPTGMDMFPEAIVRNEAFFNLNALNRGPDSGFDQDRFFAGIRTPAGKIIQGELGYQLQYFDRSSGDDLAVHQFFLSIIINFD